MRRRHRYDTRSLNPSIHWAKEGLTFSKTYLTCSTSRAGCITTLAGFANDAGVQIPLTGRLLCFLAAGSRPTLSGDSGITVDYPLLGDMLKPTTVRIVAKVSSERRLREGAECLGAGWGRPHKARQLIINNSMSPSPPRIAFFSASSAQPPLEHNSVSFIDCGSDGTADFRVLNA
jgi:hypothetical protein